MLRVSLRKLSSLHHDIQANTIFALVSHVSDRGSPVAIVRVSGSSVTRVVESLTGRTPEVRKAILCKIRDPVTKGLIDQGLVISFRKPNSYTGEDVCEFMVHGSKAVVSKLLRVLADFPGLRPAEAGEFTKRSLLNGKMDVTEAEAVRDLIESTTEVQRMRALEGVSGETSQRYSSWRQQLVKCLADVEAQIDFGEDEGIDSNSLKSSIQTIRQLKETIDEYKNESRRKSDVAKNGFQIVIIGEPNVGKSSLINRLAARDVSIVSKIEGTTRDVIEVVLNLNGHLITLCDTAGLRDTLCKEVGVSSQDSIEEEGIRRAKQRAQTADLIIFVVDASRPSLDQLNELRRENQAIDVLIVVNKTDLVNPVEEKEWSLEADCLISCKNNQGIQEIEERIKDKIQSIYSDPQLGFMTERQESLLQQVSSSLSSFIDVIDREELDGSIDFVFLAHHLRRAAKGLSSLTETNITSEDVLDVIFRDFCIGK